MIKLSPRFILVLVAACAVLTASVSYAEGKPPFTVEVADVGKGRELAAQLKAKGIDAVVPQKNMWVSDPQNNCAVWIGKNVPLDMLRTVLPEAIRSNPYLKFFYVVGDRGEKPPQSVDSTIHIGGSIEAALVKKLNVIEKDEMLGALAKASNIEELHGYLHEKNKPKAAPDRPAP